MIKVSTFCAAALLPFLFGASQAFSQTSGEERREDKYYVGLLGGRLNIGSLERTVVDEDDVVLGVEADSADMTIGTLVLGGHISELFHAEFRFGGGISDAELNSDTTISLDYFASWYFGIHYPLTTWANAYAQFGFTHLKGEVEVNNPDANQNRRFRDLEGDFPDSSFSPSWLLGLDLEVVSDTFVVFEGGRLFKDTVTDTDGLQFSAGLRYEF